MNPKKDYCYAVEAALNELGGKWKPLILYVLIDGKMRFSEIDKLLPSITQRMLTKQLRELEKDNLIHRGTSQSRILPHRKGPLCNTCSRGHL